MVDLSVGRNRGGSLVSGKIKPNEAVDEVDSTDPLCVVSVVWVGILEVEEFCDKVKSGRAGKTVESIMNGLSSFGCVEDVVCTEL